jgi:ribosomal protein S18 acetylase RimI-like enzyme
MGGALLVMCAGEEEEKIIGTSWMTFDGRRIHLHHFGILPEFQGQGLSKVLLRESLRFVKEKGYQVKLEVHRSDSKAVGIYQKAGFRYLGDYDVYIIRDLQSIDI